MPLQQNVSPWPVPPPLLLPDAEMKMRERGIKGRIKRYSNPVFLQGLFVIGIGILFVVFNAGNPYKEISGHIQNLYGETNVDGQYGASYLQIGTSPNELFIFDETRCTPVGTASFSKTKELMSTIVMVRPNDWLRFRCTISLATRPRNLSQLTMLIARTHRQLAI